jgi:hypothetical protein
VTKFSSRDRRAFGWTVVIAAALHRSSVAPFSYVTILLSLGAWFSARRPLKRNELAKADPLALAGDVELLPEAQEDVARRHPGRISGGRR